MNNACSLRSLIVGLLSLQISTSLPVLSQSNQTAPPKLNWIAGPKTIPVGDNLAQVELSKKFLFLNGDDARKLITYVKEPISNEEVGFILPNSPQKDWSIILNYSPIGYVKDDDSENLNADELLKNISEGTEEDNKEREKNGVAPIHVLGWMQKPHYDRQTHHLVWAIRASSSNHTLLNYNTRILGRSGVTSINLVTDEEQFTHVKPNVEEVIAHFDYLPDKTYGAFKPGQDPVSEIGLAALVLGGAAVAAKTGVLAKVGIFLLLAFKKIWFLLLAGPFAFLKKFFGKKPANKQEPES